MKKPKFKITKVKEDMIIIELARKIKQDDSTVSKVVNKYDLGYYRQGASSCHFLTKKDVEFVTQYFAMKKKWVQDLTNLEKKYHVRKVQS